MPGRLPTPDAATATTAEWAAHLRREAARQYRQARAAERFAASMRDGARDAFGNCRWFADHGPEWTGAATSCWRTGVAFARAARSAERYVPNMRARARSYNQLARSTTARATRQEGTT
jgi:hypothetical protein